jgi:hypothetical protein
MFTEFENFADATTSTFTSITSVNEEILWSEDNLQIYGTNSLPIILAELLGMLTFS